MFALTSAFSWENSIRLFPASFLNPRPNLPVTPGVSWLPTFAFQSPIIKRTSFWGVSSRRSSGFHRTIQLQLLLHYWLGHRLGLLWYWMLCLGNEQWSFCHFWDCIQVLHFWLFCWLWWLLHFSKGFLPTVVDIMVIWVKSTPPAHFSLVIPKMSAFTLAISCLTTSNLSWFMDLTFQVPMQYCFLQHCTLLLSPVTSRTGCCFCFGFVSSFFLALFLYWSPVAYWAPNDLGNSSFSVLSFCLFILFMGSSRQEYRNGLPFLL